MKTETPELDKQRWIINSGAPAVIQEFYDWLIGQGYILARYVEDEELLTDAYIRPEQLMADYFGIDRNKIEAERRAILDELREGQRD